eukprot:CAMPEP_0185851658 /NCGR_PEP_ID=MMETSP1354-20130828/10879_1 /TAXON_ID=708628 /ORGANISM="Erythrolobus madagascarensis, Strain CCMP3276" /LENGTH=76 /DNA_ID=CAMNT_0028552689 /DNA_START=510 /DNA_END=740 /DNA_ORIENTATION=+
MTPGYLAAFVDTEFGLIVTEASCTTQTGCNGANPVLVESNNFALSAASQGAATCGDRFTGGSRICCCSPDGSGCSV